MFCQKTINFFIFYIIFLITCVQSTTQDYMKRENSLIKPYQDGRWDIQGNAMVTNNFVRLTSDHQSKQGSVWNVIPNYLPNWELHVQFKVHGQGKDLYGDGFALWYTKDKLQPGNVFGSKDYFNGLAIFCDTYSNHNGPHNHGHPYVSAMVNNGSLSYDHDRDGTHTELAGCEAHFRNQPHETYLAIRYENNKLTVSTDIDGLNSWKPCFSVEGVRLPTGYYFGASATTGELADNHDVVAMKLYDIRTAETQINDNTDYSRISPQADFFAPPRDHIDDPKGGFMSSSLTGWKLLIIIIVGIIGLGVCGMVAFVLFMKNQDNAKKRFY